MDLREANNMIAFKQCSYCSKYVWCGEPHYYCNPEDKPEQHDEHLRTYDQQMIPIFLWVDGAFDEVRHWFAWKLLHKVSPPNLHYPWPGYWES